MPDRKPLRLETGRIQPQAPDMEQAVLGGILVDFQHAMAVVADLVQATDFYEPANADIFRIMRELYDEGEPIDILTVVDRLKREGKLEKVGGEVYLAGLTTAVTSATNIEYFCHVVFEKSLARRLIALSGELSTRAYSPAEDVLELLEEAENKIFKLSEFRVRQNATALSQSVHETIARLEAIHGHQTGVIGIPSGFRDIDNYTGGFQDTDMIVIAGRPSQGKTAFAIAISRNAAMTSQKRVGFFSLEMSTEQLNTRLIAAEAPVNAHILRTGRLRNDDWVSVTRAAAKVAGMPIWIDDTPNLSISDLRAKARRLKHEHSIDMMVVDYMQLMRGMGTEKSREQEIASISRGLKALAKELRIPVIALSQLNRSVEARQDKRPMLSDLRESGSIEQDSDVVMFVHRPEMYGIDRVDDEDTEGMAEIIIAKQRNGPTGAPKLRFAKEYTRFQDWATRRVEIPAKEEEAPF